MTYWLIKDGNSDGATARDAASTPVRDTGADGPKALGAKDDDDAANRGMLRKNRAGGA